MTKIKRDLAIHTLTISAGESESDAFDMSSYAGGVLFVNEGWTAANIGFEVAYDPNGIYNILRDDYGTPVQISNVLTSGSRAYTLPDELYGTYYTKIWSKSTVSTTETSTSQVSAQSLVVVLKG